MPLFGLWKSQFLTKLTQSKSDFASLGLRPRTTCSISDEHGLHEQRCSDRGGTFSCDLLLNSTSPNNNAHPLLNIEKNEARFFFFSLSPLVHLQGIEEHRQGVEFTLCHSKEAKNLSNLVAIHHQELVQIQLIQKHPPQNRKKQVFQVGKASSQAQLSQVN